ncbi:hypothetical protein [Gilvimarinus polysaccharolyticus]|uniref:hypothetical protein n=1 Tax=Gilvimarinus polysaccharolyticus TaxID=863921 RepID=UPI00067349A2|nr:hypothetical protein [Gilvimarinus polysaccharolyticus]
MKVIKNLLLMMLISAPLMACDTNDGGAEKLGEKLDNAAESTKDAVQDTADKVGDGVEDACEEVSGENC